ncbi:MAG: methionyl-tRNA formyltransferase [Alphaproteobacteria bacterium]
MASLRLAFMGTSEFATPTLGALAEAGHDIAAVYTQPPRLAGRGMKPRPSPVHRAANELGLTVRTPASLKDGVTQAELVALDLDVCVVVAYGLILPAAVLESPRLGCINLHPSLLPRWRGPAPIQRAIEAGDAETGVAIIAMDEGIDSGPILFCKRLTIPADATSGSLHESLAEAGAQAVVETLKEPFIPTPQSAEGLTQAAKFKPGEEALDWHRPAVELERQIRAFSPRPSARFTAGDEAVKVLAATLGDGSGQPGELLSKKSLTVACGEGALCLTRVQRPGRAATDGAAYLNGLRLLPGNMLA